MGTFSYNKPKVLSVGNRRGYIWKLTDVQTNSSSVLQTPFKKITGYMIETEDQDTPIIVTSNNVTPGGTGKCATLTLLCGCRKSMGFK